MKGSRSGAVVSAVALHLEVCWFYCSIFLCLCGSGVESIVHLNQHECDFSFFCLYMYGLHGLVDSLGISEVFKHVLAALAVTKYCYFISKKCLIKDVLKELLWIEQKIVTVKPLVNKNLTMEALGCFSR